MGVLWFHKGRERVEPSVNHECHNYQEETRDVNSQSKKKKKKKFDSLLSHCVGRSWGQKLGPVNWEGKKRGIAGAGDSSVVRVPDS